MSHTNTTDHLLIFRVDTREKEKGARALERCLILAEAHVARGGQVAFALGEAQGAASEVIAARGFRRIPITASVGSKEDSEQLLRAVSDGGAKAVVVEGRKFASDYLKALASKVYTAVIEQGGERVLPVQLIINSSFSADEHFYTCRADSRLLLGPKFKLVRQDLRAWPKPEQPSGDVVEEVNSERVFVTSSDDHTSARILDAMPSPSKTTIITLLGSRSCSDLDQSARAACARGYIVEQISRSTLTDCLPFCDLAIVTNESFSGQIGYLGIPTLCLSKDRDSSREVHRMAEEGANMHTPPLSETNHQELTQAIRDFLVDEPQRKRFGKRIESMIDGNGANRILGCIEQAVMPRLHVLKAA